MKFEITDDLGDISETAIEVNWRLISIEKFNDIDLEFRTCCNTLMLGYWFDFEDRKRFKIVCQSRNKEGIYTPFDGILREFKDSGLEPFILEYIKSN
ncbi:MAG: hypothetical protein JXR69_04760 [Candidatus Delongbacteria bacterium]|nr:hypothetical protein [Candidatus Delongbacteria bacterium]